MATRRTERWWKERWMARHYCKLKSPLSLAGDMEYRNINATELARAASIIRIRNGSNRGVSRQFIAALLNPADPRKTVQPDLADAICAVLDVRRDTLFTLHEKSSDEGQTVKAGTAA